MAQADYQRTNGATTVEKFIAEYEPQARLNDRTFAFGLGRWERDRMQGFDVRWSASGGLGYKIVDNKAMTLNLKAGPRSEEHTSELQSLMRISYAVFCLKKKKYTNKNQTIQ